MWSWVSHLGRSKKLPTSFGTASSSTPARFDEITGRSQTRFEAQDWAGAHADAVERLELYPAMAGEVRSRLGDLLGEDIDNRDLWIEIKAAYSARLADRDVWEIGETFYNSVTRLVFVTTGVDPQVEFVSTDFLKPPTRPQRQLYYRYDRAASAERLVEAILTDFRFGVLYQDIRRDARRVGAEIEALLDEFGEPGLIERAEVVGAVFYREQGAYLVGRIYRGARLIPFVLALRNRRGCRGGRRGAARRRSGQHPVQLHPIPLSCGH